MRPSGGHVMAGSLKKLGGDTVLEPDGRHVDVVRATRLPAHERNTVQLRIDGDTVPYSFVVTSNHSLLAQAEFRF